jgi:hypothetical protein
LLHFEAWTIHPIPPVGWSVGKQRPTRPVQRLIADCVKDIHRAIPPWEPEIFACRLSDSLRGMDEIKLNRRESESKLTAICRHGLAAESLSGVTHRLAVTRRGKA